MTKYPTPITQENFDTAWKCIARKRLWSIKKELIRRVSVTIAQLVYFFVFLILAFGVFYEMGGSFIRLYIDQIPQAGIWWNQLSAPVLAGVSTEAMRILRWDSVSSAVLHGDSPCIAHCSIVPSPDTQENRRCATGCLAAAFSCQACSGLCPEKGKRYCKDLFLLYGNDHGSVCPGYDAVRL